MLLLLLLFSLSPSSDDAWTSLENPSTNLIGSWTGGAVALVLAIVHALQISRSAVDDKHKRTKEIAEAIQAGAKAFLKEEYKHLSVFCLMMGVILALLPGLGWESMLCFWFGAILSALAGWMGMWIATLSINIRATIACTGANLNRGLQV